MANRGKTHVINRMTAKDFDSGHEFTTSGVSVKYAEMLRKKIIFIDTQGRNACVPLPDNKDGKAMFEGFYDVKCMEQFLQDFIVEVSNVLIVVLGSLTSPEQCFVYEIAQAHPSKLILVLHNLSECDKIDQVETRIAEDISNAFDAQRLQQGQDVWESRTVNRGQRVIHLVMAKEGSDAGYHYNDKTFARIQDELTEQSDRLPRDGEFDVVARFVRFANSNLATYVKVEEKNSKKPEVKIAKIDGYERIVLASKGKVAPRKIVIDVYRKILSGGVFKNESGYAVFQEQSCFKVVVDAPLLKKNSYKPVIVEVGDQDALTRALEITAERERKAFNKGEPLKKTNESIDVKWRIPFSKDQSREIGRVDHYCTTYQDGVLTVVIGRKVYANSRGSGGRV
eukprot:TRINITY_DN9312_c0_g1_i2.p1 TRINITY_DN9312_c0_g1~~TRINITY_DN9312_c0_g1_i2.p1  ORF type:complete len:396 (+),score=68.39 TRINITY_DN9312_c0_g1_i2:386-1573(+)